MALIPWKPLFDIDRFFEDEDRFLPMISWKEPAMDIYETDKEVVAEVNLPGIDPDKVNIAVKDNVLRITGTTEEKKEEKGKDYWRKEIRKGSFERMARLPVSVKEGKVEASYKDGVLKITMPKLEVKPEKKVKIKVKKK